MLNLIHKVTQLLIINVYKVYLYLVDVLSGLTYLSEELLDEDEGTQVKWDLYSFLFHGHSSTWPCGDGGRLILMVEEDRGVKPTYLYSRLLLFFDAKAFLHVLDLAFEDTYLNGKAHSGISWLIIMKILLKILTSSPSPSSLPPTVWMFIHIFVTHNMPKYTQFIQMLPSVLHSNLG